MSLQELKDALEIAFAHRSLSGEAKLPLSAEPIKLDDVVIPGGARVFFTPVSKSKCPVNAKPKSELKRSADQAIVYLDNDGSCVTLGPDKPGGYKIKSHDRTQHQPRAHLTSEPLWVN